MVPLAAGEQFSSKWEFRQLIEEELIDYARVDLCIVGGFTETRKIAGWWMLTDVIPVQPEWEDGYLLPPPRPGLGIEFDREAAKKHSFQMAEPPHLHRLDGSFTNWLVRKRSDDATDPVHIR